ncbi:hypothetical protein [Dyella sp.]|uniref:hypothetical protein n=1 Tax=Dyella sp. TaxID=1869338 RepID=UPI002FD8B53E
MSKRVVSAVFAHCCLGKFFAVLTGTLKRVDGTEFPWKIFYAGCYARAFLKNFIFPGQQCTFIGMTNWQIEFAGKDSLKAGKGVRAAARLGQCHLG